MLSCEECERYLPVFLDQALGVQLTLDLEAHLQDCPPCGEQAARERCIRAFFRQSLQVPDLPDELKQRMVFQVMQADGPPRWYTYLPRPSNWRDFAFGGVAAALLVLALTGWFPDLSSDRDLQQVVRETSLAYGTHTSQHMPLEVVSADETAVTKWLSQRMGFPVQMPWMSDTSMQLVGGRLCRILDRKSAAVMYQRHGVPLVLFAFRGDHLSLHVSHDPPRSGHPPIQMRHVSGRPVAMWQKDGIVYSMVGDMPRDDLMQVASSINNNR